MDKNDYADWKAQSPVIVERNVQGKASKVCVQGTVYEVFMREPQHGCIQPRAAGLRWGNYPAKDFRADRRR